MMLAFDSVTDLQVPLAAKVIGDADTAFAGVSTDSREIKAGNLFVALLGERFNGHEFIEQAVSRGSHAVVISEEPITDYKVPALMVADTSLALGRLGALNRLNWQGELVAITGSNGKTTIKEMLGAILDKALLTAANNNNTLGVPLTLLRLSAEHDYAVIEMGTDSPGEIAYSASLAKPSIALLNNIGKAHLAGFGTSENIAREKGTLLEHLSADGIAVLNGDDEFCPLWEELLKTKQRRVIKFGFSDGCDILVSGLTTNNAKISFQLTATEKLLEVLGDNMSKKLPPSKFIGTSIPIDLPLAGVHNAMNATAAFATGCCLGLEPASMVSALAKFDNLSGRLEYIELAEGCFLYDDSYNANPSSMASGLQTLATAGEGDDNIRCLAILGDMYELGDAEIKEHQALGELVAKLKIDGVLVCGKFAAEVIKGYRQINPSDAATKLVQQFASTDELNSHLAQLHRDKPFKQTAFFVKGSRAAAMEDTVRFIIRHLGKSKR